MDYRYVSEQTENLKKCTSPAGMGDFSADYAIPRCSKNEEQIIEWLKDFAKSHNLACRSDAVGNTCY